MDFMEFSFAVIGGLLVLATSLASAGALGLLAYIGAAMGAGILAAVFMASRGVPWRLYVLAFAAVALLLGQGFLFGPVLAALAALLSFKRQFLPETYEKVGYRKRLIERRRVLR